MGSTVTPLAAFLGGALTLLAPCSVMLLPAFFAYAFTSRRTLLARTAVFWLGLATTLVPLGAAAGGLGAVLREQASALTTAVGAVVIALGLSQALAVDLPLAHLVRGPRSRHASATRDSASALSVYLLGAVYGLAGVGCAGPVLGAVLLMAGIGGEPLPAAGLMLLYAAGMALPLTLLALVWDALDLSSRSWLRPREVRLLGRRTTWTNLLSGLLLTALGVGLLVAGPVSPVGGLVDGETLARVETEVMAAAGRVPWWGVAGSLAALAAGVVVTLRGRAR